MHLRQEFYIITFEYMTASVCRNLYESLIRLNEILCNNSFWPRWIRFQPRYPFQSFSKFPTEALAEKRYIMCFWVRYLRCLVRCCVSRLRRIFLCGSWSRITEIMCCFYQAELHRAISSQVRHRIKM